MCFPTIKMCICFSPVHPRGNSPLQNPEFPWQRNGASKASNSLARPCKGSWSGQAAARTLPKRRSKLPWMRKVWFSWFWHDFDGFIFAFMMCNVVHQCQRMEYMVLQFYNLTSVLRKWRFDHMVQSHLLVKNCIYIYIYSHPGLHVWALISTIRTHHTPFGECSKQYSKEQTTSKYVGSLQTRDSWQRMQTNIHQARQQSPNAIKKKQDLTLACFIFANLSTIKSQEATYKHADSETPPWSLFEGYPTNCHVGQRYDGWQWVEQKW